MDCVSPMLSGVAPGTGRFGLAGSFFDGKSPFCANLLRKGPLLLLQDGYFVGVLEFWINTFDPRASALALTTVCNDHAAACASGTAPSTAPNRSIRHL